jgi:hypothetical protein
MADKILAEIKRGDDAKKILENKVYIEAFETVKNNIIDAMNTSPLGDDKTNNRIVIALQNLSQIEKALTDVMQTGKMAKIQVEDKRFRVFG